MMLLDYFKILQMFVTLYIAVYAFTIRDQYEDDYTLQTSLNFLKVLIQTFYTFIIYIVRKSALETQW